MDEDKLAMFRNRLVKVFRHLKKSAKRQAITCYRVYDHDIPEFPFCIELYGDQLYIAEYKRFYELGEEEHATWLVECLKIITQILEIPHERIHLRQRKKKADRTDQYEKINSEMQLYIVNEAGLEFKINLTDYLDTGLFLDHRSTRAMVRKDAKNKRVLNLFCYTGSFSVYAASGGAVSVTSVDLSKTYLNWAEENMALNHFFDIQRYQFIHADVKQYLRELGDDAFDLVILDPPSFSNSKRMKDFLDIQRDHVTLLNDTLSVMKIGGQLFFSTNLRKFWLDAEAIKASSIKDITKVTTAFDFQGREDRPCYLLIK